MSKESLVFFLGLVLVLVPFLGVPDSWKDNAAVFAGALLIFTGYRLRRAAFLRQIQQVGGEHRTDSFAEHGPDTQSPS